MVKLARAANRVLLVNQARSACQENQASVDRVERPVDEVTTDVQASQALQASKGCVDLGEIVERMALLANTALTDRQVKGDLKDLMETQEGKAHEDHVVYPGLVDYQVLLVNQAKPDLRANAAHQARKVTVERLVHRVRLAHQVRPEQRVHQVPRVLTEMPAHQAYQENTARAVCKETLDQQDLAVNVVPQARVVRKDRVERKDIVVGREPLDRLDLVALKVPQDTLVTRVTAMEAAAMEAAIMMNTSNQGTTSMWMKATHPLKSTKLSRPM